jgi:hypothetical protein
MFLKLRSFVKAQFILPPAGLRKAFVKKFPLNLVTFGLDLRNISEGFVGKTVEKAGERNRRKD